MLCACVDIGSNTTRMLVGEVDAGRLRERLQLRAFTRIGAELSASGRLSGEKIDEVVAVVREYLEIARREGAEVVRTVATAAVRDAVNGHELLEALAARAEVDVVLLSGADEARLAFLGATRTLGRPLSGAVAVVDVGGRSTEIAIGTVAGGVSWARSLPVGSGMLTDRHRRGDGIGERELAAMRADAEAVIAAVEPPPVDCGVAVGGSATSLRRIVGPRLASEAAANALEKLCDGSPEQVAERFDLAGERVRLLPAGILILAAAAERLGRPLELGCGGIREGVLLELAGDSGPARRT